MSDCPETLAKNILKNEREACESIRRLIKAIHEQKKLKSCDEQVRNSSIEDFPEIISTTLDNLSVCDVTDAAFDHAVRVLYRLGLELDLIGTANLLSGEIKKVSAVSDKDVDDMTHETARVIERFGVKLDSDLYSDLNDVLAEFLSNKCGVEIQ